MINTVVVFDLNTQLNTDSPLGGRPGDAAPEGSPRSPSLLETLGGACVAASRDGRWE